MRFNRVLLLILAFAYRSAIFCEFLSNEDEFCDLSDNKEALSAISRAKTDDCKKELKRVSCQLKLGTLFNHTQISPRLCTNQEREHLGCIDLNEKEEFFSLNKNNTFIYKDIENIDLCLAVCITFNNQHFLYDEVENTCHCLFKAKSSVISQFTRHECENGGLDIYKTGLSSRSK